VKGSRGQLYAVNKWATERAEYSARNLEKMSDRPR